tara:strand:+ start:1522 stop:1935 length:414 start_codon:yes stop_codon:yes gene_type:complete
MPLNLEIVTPDCKVYSQVVDEVGIPTSEGRIDVLPRHVPLIARLKAGDIMVKTNDQVEHLAVGSGFVEVFGDAISILTDQAINIEDVEDSEIEEAVRRAQEALDEGKKSDLNEADINRLEAQIRYAHAQQVARGKHR